MSSGKKPITYKDAGVDIGAGDALVGAIKPLAASTKRSGADSDLGGFGGLFDLKAAGFKDPVLVAATDGVGSKVKIALECNILETVGIDLVAMCVNDLVVQGAEPLFFLDYYATGHLEVGSAHKVVSGIAEGCRQAGCALIGGETAEMPGLYAGKDFDLAGFSVGAAERGTLLDGSTVKAGDVILGLGSSGIHSNGFSLVRKIVEQNDLSYFSTKVFDEQVGTLGEVFLAPTKIYVRSLLGPIRDGKIKALSHITGGGLLENIPRTLPDHTKAIIDADSWQPHPVFNWLREMSATLPAEMVRTFNCGIGMAVVVSAADEDAVFSHLRSAGEQVYKIGHIEENADKEPITVVESKTGALGYGKPWRAQTGGQA